MMQISSIHRNRTLLKAHRTQQMPKGHLDKQQRPALATESNNTRGLLAASLSLLDEHTPTSTQLKHAAGYLVAGTLVALHSYPSTIFEDARQRQQNQDPRVNMAIASGAYALGIAAADYYTDRKSVV